LVGLAVRTETGERVGVVEEIWELPGNPVVVVRDGTKEVLIPAAKEFVVAVDLIARIMTIRLIDGLGD
jgi:16S rRNA processing protein RimM